MVLLLNLEIAVCVRVSVPFIARRNRFGPFVYPYQAVQANDVSCPNNWARNGSFFFFFLSLNDAMRFFKLNDKLLHFRERK